MLLERDDQRVADHRGRRHDHAAGDSGRIEHGTRGDEALAEHAAGRGVHDDRVAHDRVRHHTRFVERGPEVAAPGAIVAGHPRRFATGEGLPVAAEAEHHHTSVRHRILMDPVRHPAVPAWPTRGAIERRHVTDAMGADQHQVARQARRGADLGVEHGAPARLVSRPGHSATPCLPASPRYCRHGGPGSPDGPGTGGSGARRTGPKARSAGASERTVRTRRARQRCRSQQPESSRDPQAGNRPVRGPGPDLRHTLAPRGIPSSHRRASASRAAAPARRARRRCRRGDVPPPGSPSSRAPPGAASRAGRRATRADPAATLRNAHASRRSHGISPRAMRSEQHHSQSRREAATNGSTPPLRRHRETSEDHCGEGHRQDPERRPAEQQALPGIGSVPRAEIVKTIIRTAAIPRHA